MGYRLWTPFRVCAVIVALMSPTYGVVYDLGVGDSIALDQPRTRTEIYEDSTLLGPNPLTALDIQIVLNDHFVLDTGANAILVAMGGHYPVDPDPSDLTFPDVDPNLYEQALRTDPSGIAAVGNNLVFYTETGVAGDSLLKVLKAYEYRATDSPTLANPNPVATAIQGGSTIHALADPTLDMGSFGGIMGMPAMVDRVVWQDLTGMIDVGLIQVAFDTAPAATANSMTFDLTQLPPVLSGKQFPTDPEPLFSPLPLLDNIAAASGLDSAAGAWLVDTGAQISMISGALAQALNIDYLTPTASGGDQLDVLAVGGVGGDVAVPLVSLDSLTLTDNNGDSLVVHDIIVGVLDVEGLPVDGILGSNLLTSGYIEQLFAPEVSFGMFTDVVFDFTGGTWTMRLDRNPDYEIVDAGLSPTELQGLLDTQVAFLTSAAWPWSIDTVSVIPEPASLMLLAPAMMMLRRRRR